MHVVGATNTIRVATFNTWFGDRGFDARASALAEILASCDADVIGLQEVTPRLLATLRACPWTQSYAWSATSDAEVEPYGTVLMSRMPVVQYVRIPLWSYQGRHLEIAKLEGGWCVATVHLESRSASAEIRETQLEAIFAELVGQTCVLMGDFNFDPSGPEQASLPSRYRDIWLELRPLEEGYTIDTSANEMAAAEFGKHKHVRFDRILTSGDAYTAVRVDRLGMHELADSAGLWPSDHFGVVAEFAPRMGRATQRWQRTGAVL